MAGKPGQGPNPQIFEQQAAQGYYDDAWATARLFKQDDDLQWAVVELAKIRAENGDVQGAKNMVNRFAGSDLGAKATEAIALAQLHSGDLPGALATSGDSSEVWLAFGRLQIANGDLEGALKTAEQMKSKSAGQLFYEVGDALRARGEQKRVRELASHMSNPEMAALFRKLVRFTLWYREHHIEIETVQLTPCDNACFDATHGKFAEADSLVEQNKCSNVSFVASQQYAIDPVGAERLLRNNADPQDLARGLDEFAMAEARKGDITQALRFLDDFHRIGGLENQGQPVHEIARSWTIRDGPKLVLQWVHSRPTTEERTWALIGIAEALGHARPAKRRNPAEPPATN